MKIRTSRDHADRRGGHLGALALVLGITFSTPAFAQTAGSAIDQPTAGTLPPGTSTVKGGANVGNRNGDQVAPASVIQSSTDVMQGGGTVQSKSHGGATDPIKHLPKDMR